MTAHLSGLFTSELTWLSESVLSIWHQTYSTMFVNKWKHCLHSCVWDKQTKGSTGKPSRGSHTVCYMFVLHHVCLCVGVMGKWNWDPKHWMMFCTGPSWSSCPKRCWWVQSLSLCYCHTSPSSMCVSGPVACVCVLTTACDLDTHARLWFWFTHSTLCCIVLLSVCVEGCKHSVILLDYLHAFHSAPLSYNPWGPGSRGLDLSSQYYYTSQGVSLYNNQNTRPLDSHS